MVTPAYYFMQSEVMVIQEQGLEISMIIPNSTHGWNLRLTWKLRISGRVEEVVIISALHITVQSGLGIVAQIPHCVVVCSLKENHVLRWQTAELGFLWVNRL